MKHTKGNTLIEAITTITGIIVTILFLLPTHTQERIMSEVNNFLTPTEKVIEYDGK